MTAALTVVPSPRRTTSIIAEEIRREVDAAGRSFRDWLGHAVRVGELLTEAKAQVKHGEWIPWLKENFPGSVRTATNYRRLAANRQTVAHLSGVAEALEALTTPKVKAEPEHMEAEYIDGDMTIYTGSGEIPPRPVADYNRRDVPACVFSPAPLPKVGKTGQLFAVAKHRACAKGAFAWFGPWVCECPDCGADLYRNMRRDSEATT